MQTKPDGFSSNFTHNVAFSTEILVAETQEIVDDKCFVTVAECVKVHIVAVFVKEKKGEPRSEGVDGDDEENPDYPALLRGVSVEPQILVNLQRENENGHKRGL